MDGTHWEAGLRGAAIALFLLLALLFARDWRKAISMRLGAALTFAAACYVALIAFDSSYAWDWRHFPLHVMSLSAPALFWLFAASWFDDEFELRPGHVAFVAATVGTGIVANYLYWVRHIELFGLGVGWRAFSVAAVVMAMRATIRGWSADLVETRRRVRIGLCIVIALVIIWLVVSEIGVRGWPPPLGWRLVNAAGMMLLAIAVAVMLLGWRDPELLVAPMRRTEPERSRADFDDAPLLVRLDAEMTRERLYRQDGLTITAVAARLGVPEYRLRRAINQGLGARNFNAYLNAFRLKETEDALADPAQAEVPILTIALDAGFGSLAPFNRAFRDRHGCTPSDYRSKHLP